MSRDSVTKFLYAAGEGRLDAVRALLADGVDVNSANHLGYTALMSAAASYRVEVVRFLLEAGASSVATTTEGYTALHVAVGSTPSLPDEQRDCVRLLIASGALLDAPTDAGLTPLMNAAWFGCDLSVTELLDAGADPEISNAQGNSAEQLASQKGHHELAHLIASRRSAS